jgi:ABC-type polysaccharide/polyol phosphate export permease
MGLSTETHHDVFFAASWPSLEALAMLALYTLASLLVGARIFDDYRDTFPELV